MKKITFCFSCIIFSIYCFGQVSDTTKNADSLMNQKINKFYNQYETKSLQISLENERNILDSIFNNNNNDSITLNKVKIKIEKLNLQIKPLKELNNLKDEQVYKLYNYELNYGKYSFTDLSDSSLFFIQSIVDLDYLKMLNIAIEEQKVKKNQLVIKDKLLNAISKQMKIIGQNELAWYNYSITKKQLIKAVCISTSNDLFTPAGVAGLFGGKWYNFNNKFQKNDDRDYTGGVLVELTTDYLKFKCKHPPKSYQTIIYGTDVFTPYFRDTSVFVTDTSINRKDRPFGSFQFVGIGNHGITKKYRFRWNLSFKVGKIGGTRGKLLQTVLHQDISYSPRPIGWGAQIANKGRTGLSVEGSGELLLGKKSYYKYNIRYKRKKIFFPSIIFDFKFGTFMTYVGLGAQVSNKNFFNTNTNFAIKRTEFTNVDKQYFWKYLMVTGKFNVRYVQHNTMLEGYGWLKTNEKNDPYTPKSKWYLSDSLINRFVATYDLIISYQFRYITLFYKFSVISPETKLNKIGIKDENGIEMDISNRWHHWATIGVNFIIN